MSKIRLEIQGGGIFSLFMTGVQFIANRHHASVYYNVGHSTNITKEIPFNVNPFNFVFKQDSTGHSPMKTVTQRVYNATDNKIEHSPKINHYREIVNNINYQDDFIELLNGEVEKLAISDKTLGVHVRLTDMNKLHPQYGIINFEQFKAKIDEALLKKDYDNIFIASDNVESVNKLIEVYGDKIKYVNGIDRAEKEEDLIKPLIINNFVSKEYWQSVFLDTLLLSKCGDMICRVSNLANAAYIFSNTINNVYRL